MRIFQIFFLCVLLNSLACHLNSQNLSPTSRISKKYLQEAIKIAKKESLYRDSVDWVKIEKEMFKIAKDAQATKDCYPAMYHLISELRKKGDNHSNFHPSIQSVKNKIQNLDDREPSGKYLGDFCGYIKVPGFVSINQKISNAFASEIQQIIKDIDTHNDVKNWIVDLRENTGGNMYPMIAGLGPLLGEGVLGYFTHVSDKKPHKWKYKNGEAIINQKVLCKVEKPYYLRNNNIRIIVLIGPNTKSSGEMTVISFMSKNNVTFIGQATGGYATGNQSYTLSDGSVLNLCSSYCYDRELNKITGKIQPQEKIEFHVSDENDKTIEYVKKKFLEMK